MSFAENVITICIVASLICISLVKLNEISAQLSDVEEKVDAIKDSHLTICSST